MRRYLFIIMLLACLFLAGAKDQSITVQYSFTENRSVEESVDFSSLLLKLGTDIEATCRYDSDKGLPYENMEGRFDLTYGTLHEKSFVELGDGIYKYYVRCMDSGGLVGEEMEIVIRVNSLVKGQIALENEEPLKDGRYEVTLVTSKIVSQTPSLSSSFDGAVYEPIPLVGSGKVWKGYMIIPKGSGEGVVSFKFSANDLEGRQGNEISSGSAYLIDTVKPSTISSIEAIGYKGEVKLEWYLDEDDIDKFKIYKSRSPQVKITDFYSDAEKSPFYDRGVESGETYYYRISGIDEAGNEGELSFEVSSTALLDNKTSSEGLDLQLLGKVDNFLKELDVFIGEIESIEGSVDEKQEKEKEIFNELDLVNEIENAGSEAVMLKKDVEKYKLQDLSEEELDNKINSARVKMNIIKKGVPESLTVLSEDSVNDETLESELEEIVLEIQQDVSEKAREGTIKKSLRIAEESELAVKSYFYVVDVIYMDGGKKTVSIVKRVISSSLGEIEWDGNGNFIERVPKTIAETTSEIEIQGLNYKIIEEDPILGFGADSREILYYFDKEVSLATLKEIDSAFVAFEEEKIKSSVTGYFFIDIGKTYAGIVVGIVIILGLSIYFIYLKKEKGSEKFIILSRKIEESHGFLKIGERDNAIRDYGDIRELYDDLDEKEKKRIYGKVKRLFNKIKEGEK